MSVNATEILNAFFFDGADAPADGDLRIDVVDSWTTSDLAAVRPTTISWSEARVDAAR
ncbi:hypothetical protein RM555_25465 [Micromonospora sp. DSM 115977]|uniref:Uncharacterized protein n=1 Tax=Micromonospora reichwaldensis TaxID=3075516 RepID=A0ABU2X3K3_9ACTN|nr:hypothetical protein [Micromonospora sp. DSM 115977]MDT0532355.1 hypothetical protein [Micromonospora sp. DSM 115977]